MRTPVSVLAILLTVLTAVPRVHAQASHTATQSAIDAALEQHVSSVAADRADVLRVLEHPAVKEVAARAGIDLRRAASAVTTVEGHQLEAMASQARQVEQALAGGQSRVVISTTVIIIALLVIILLIVALD
ncbi:MAG TPA: hypothetical protein VFS23_13680 [Vicinamibacterales bacterium]|nr:hypothetical protein [Vicinamibacterales bacterium]